MSEDKPDLAAVLDHYGVIYNPNKSSQKCLCPVHEEHVQSCSVNLDEGWWNCQACNAKGDSWNLIMLKEGLDFGPAVQYAKSISLSCGTNVPQTNESRADGLFGRSRPVSRDRKVGAFRPSLRAVERS